MRIYRKFLSAVAAAAIAFSGMGSFPAGSPAQAAGKVLAFPGAGGAGRYSTGGRGGEVYHVTNLNDSGEGSFREAVGKSGRVVVFDVSGTIELKGNILCQSNVTILGQTAPGGSGITLKNYKMGMSGDNIICRFISSRPGPYASTSSGNDAWGGAKGAHSIIDHCSMGWTTDEQWGLYSNNEYYTVQYSVLGPADSWGGHKKGLHGFGIMLGNGWLSFDHNLIIHNVSRNFRGKVPDKKTADFTNNVIYDWGYQTTYGTIGHLNYVNNTLKAGKSTTGGYHWMYVDSTTKPENFGVYCAGNRMINKDGSVNGITYNNWDGVTVKDGIGITKNSLYSAQPFQTIQDGENVSSVPQAESAEASFEHVVSYAGNGITPDKRTAIDRQCADETRKGTGSCSGTSAYDGSVTDLNKYSIQCGVSYSYPAPVLTPEITDADHDGMDDAWELARGLNPADPTDNTGDYCGLGYMNIEYYANDLTVGAFPAGVVQTSPLQGIEATSAFENIQAEDFAAQEGIQAEEQEDGSKNIGYVENGDYIMFRKIDFGTGAQSITARVSGNPCKIEVYTDSLSGTPAGVLDFPGTSGYSDYQEFTWGIKRITGQHNLYLKFTGGEGYLLNMDSFVFGTDRIPNGGRIIADLQVADGAYPESWSIADNAAVGSLVFGDRDVTFITLPDALSGAEQILTACNAKNTTGDLAQLSVKQECDLYILLDNRVEAAGKTPDWLGDFTRTDMEAQNSFDVTFSVYQKTMQAGEEITLGTNNMNGNCVCYAVMLQAREPEVTSTTATTTTTTETTTTTTASTTTEPAVTTTGEDTTTTEATTTGAKQPAGTPGDLNLDGSITVSDAVLMARLAGGDATLVLKDEAKPLGDMDADGGFTANDLKILLLVIVGANV